LFYSDDKPRVNLVAYNIIYTTKLMKTTINMLTPQSPIASNYFNHENILKPQTIGLFKCKSQISVMPVVQLW